MQFDTINTLYLELSQVATATTAKELALRAQLDAVDAVLWPDGNKPDGYEADRATRLRAVMKLRKSRTPKVWRDGKCNSCNGTGNGGDWVPANTD